MKAIHMVKIGELKPRPNNRNSHPRGQIDRLAEIIKYQGFRRPLVVSTLSGLIVCGHGRLEAARKLGLKEVPVIYQDYADEDQEYADHIADNSLQSWSELDLSGINVDLADLSPDFNLDMLGIEGFVLEPADKLDPQCDEDEVPSAPVEPNTKLGDVYRLGRHLLMCGDSTSVDAVEKLFGESNAELCFTSPPYADQREYNGGKELSTEFLATFIRAAVGKASYFAVNLGYSRKNGAVNPYWDDYIKEAQGCGLSLLSWNIWDRSGYGASIGNQTAMFAIWHEWIFVFGNELKELNRTKPNKSAGSKSGTNRNADGTTTRGSGVTAEFGKIGTVTQTRMADGKLHPAMFPVELPEQYIEAMTDPGQGVYEPFGGSGTTMIAAEKTGRNCFMMELDPKYCDVIVARWEKYTGQKAELVNV